MGIFNIIAEKKAKFKALQQNKRQAALAGLEKQAKEAQEEAKLTKAIEKEKAKIKSLKGPSKLEKVGTALRNAQKNGFLTGQSRGPASSGGVFGQPTKNIHEGTGRNIWDEASPTKTKAKKETRKQVIINL